MPLAKHLFQVRGVSTAALNQFPAASPFFNLLTEGGGEKGVEGVLSELWIEASTYEDGPKQFAALRYYLDYVVFQSQNRWMADTPYALNHINLLDEIRRNAPVGEDVVLVTFNYDSLIEFALAQQGFPIRSLGDFVNKHRFKLVKLHGSTTWFRSTSMLLTEGIRNGEDSVRRRLIDEAGRYELGNEFYWREDTNTILHAGTGLLPAIAIPLQEKAEFECPEYHLDALRTRLKDVTHVLTIGWRGMESTFLRLLTEGLRQPVAIGAVSESEGEATKTISNILRLGIPQRGTKTFPMGFSNFVKGREGRSFLATLGGRT